jgi:hypothetical protein
MAEKVILLDQHAAPHVHGKPPRPPIQLGVRSGQKGPWQAATLAQGHLATMAGGADGCAPSKDVFQSLDTAAPPACDRDVDVHKAKLS